MFRHVLASLVEKEYCVLVGFAEEFERRILLGLPTKVKVSKGDLESESVPVVRMCTSTLASHENFVQLIPANK